MRAWPTRLESCTTSGSTAHEEPRTVWRAGAPSGGRAQDRGLQRPAVSPRRSAQQLQSLPQGHSGPHGQAAAAQPQPAAGCGRRVGAGHPQELWPRSFVESSGCRFICAFLGERAASGNRRARGRHLACSPMQTQGTRQHYAVTRALCVFVGGSARHLPSRPAGAAQTVPRRASSSVRIVRMRSADSG